MTKYDLMDGGIAIGHLSRITYLPFPDRKTYLTFATHFWLPSIVRNNNLHLFLQVHERFLMFITYFKIYLSAIILFMCCPLCIWNKTKNHVCAAVCKFPFKWLRNHSVHVSEIQFTIINEICNHFSKIYLKDIPLDKKCCVTNLCINKNFNLSGFRLLRLFTGIYQSSKKRNCLHIY